MWKTRLISNYKEDKLMTGCDSINKEPWKEFYKNNPDFFVEYMMGIKLLPYQKVLLRTIYRRKYASLIERYYIILEYLKNNKGE